MFFPIKQLALSASLIWLLCCLTACQKKEALQIPAKNIIEKPESEHNDRTVEVRAGEEFSIDLVDHSDSGTLWFLLLHGPESLSYAPKGAIQLVKKIRIVDETKRKDTRELEGMPDTTYRWIFRVPKTVNPSYPGYPYHLVFMLVGPAGGRIDKTIHLLVKIYP